MGRPAAQEITLGSEPPAVTGYRWRSAEQLAGLIDTQEGPTWFEHDARGHLVSARRADGTVQHRAADAAGNVYRSADHSDRRYGKGGRIEEMFGVRYGHDEDGQLVERLLPDGRSWRYAWDLAGQLVEVTRPDGRVVSFAYDALGRRVRKASGGKSTRYVWDGNDLVHDVCEAGATVTWVFEPGVFAPLAKEEGSKRFGLVTGGLGTPRAMTDEAGELAWKAQLDVYGVARTDVMKSTCPWRWPGQYEDEETGLFYNRFRYYDPVSGQYLSADPIGLAGGMRAYAYVKDTNSWSDPFGLSGAPGCPGDLLEQAVENRLNAEGIPILQRNAPVLDAAGNVVGEIDFEVSQAIIETTVSPGGKLSQLQKYLSPLFNPSGKPVIIFAPNYGSSATRDIERAGGLVAKHLDDLVALVR
jgi:RHS repeat-associated protein